MGQLDNLPDNMESEDFNTPQELLRTMTYDLKTLQQDVVAQLHQDIRRLQAEKSRLMNDIEKLQTQQQTLQSQHEVTLSRQQLAQQQAWAKQLALALANHLHTALMQRLSQTLSTQPMPRSDDMPQIAGSAQGGAPIDPENTYRVLASIDETINHALASLRHDLNSYQSALSQQISRMHDLGQQGEAILDVLVSRISQQLQAETLKNRSERSTPDSTARSALGSPPAPKIVPSDVIVPPLPKPPALTPPSTSVAPVAEPFLPAPMDQPSSQPSSQSSEQAASDSPTPAEAPELAAVVPTPPTTPTRSTPARRSPFQAGFLLILFSTATLALHHVIVQIIGTSGRLFGSEALQVGGFIQLSTFSSALLVLWVRMVAIVPLMAWLSGLLYRPVWRDFRSFFVSRERRLLWSLIGSGIFLMLSQVFLYVAIGELGPAVGVAISSLYPLVTLPLMWLLFGERPSRLRMLAVFAIALGIAFTVFAARSLLSDQGMLAAVISGVTFGLYLVSMMLINRRKLNPLPISLIQNATIFVFSSLFLIGFGSSAAPSNWSGLIISGLILGGLTIVSYILNDVGSRILGAARATLITASVPALTALLAFLILPNAQNFLSLGQIIGILILTMGIAALSLERILNQHKPVRSVGR
ncbi:DMT family transporter [Thermocoleostomius sinensis]|uniref:EamA family transporter n=1 Tax=Thermocoleostomius sinensis A174 TaxID=2016057 RepID=A0A9E8ZE10_9CYAN|nr:EamA family transporter [Thermocoleostomius sinensis]WAL61237.1 EamA family transporter [Thermocoleostomius sinensis A174]